MKKVIVGLVGIVASFVGQAGAAEFEDYARILSVSERAEQVSKPRQECITETVQTTNERGVAGSIIGGVAGGLLGNQVGKGNGRTAATAAGAITGAIVGDRVQNQNNSGQQPVQRCHTVNELQTTVTGYFVTYEFKGSTYTDVVPFRPTGDHMRVRAHLTLTP